jgi:tRNA pseudouridine38-40 synthase
MEQLKTLAILTEYDGSAFHGWQRQPRERSVQATLQQALSRLTGEQDLVLTGCSRTDAGVHARGHISSFSSSSAIPVKNWPLALNSVLPEDISVLAAREVPAGFSARFDAKGKVYSYSVWHAPVRPALDRRSLCHLPGNLDFNAMARALPFLTGRHDFKAFADQGSPARTTVRTVKEISLHKKGPLVRLYFTGDSFLYHMVRILAGTILAVGQGKLTPPDLPGIIKIGDRRAAGKTMPAHGLCLEHVFYEPALFGPWQLQLEKESELNVQSTLE